MKRIQKLNDQGVAHLGLIVIIILVISVIGFAGWRVLKNQDKDNISTTNQTTVEGNNDSKTDIPNVAWMWGGDKWLPEDPNVTACKEPPKFNMPVDINSVTSVLYPGQQRSTGYKTHGGFLFANTSNNKAEVTVPVDSHLIKASRYIEMGDVQYFFVFTHPCGYAYRLDHLKTLSPKFQEIVDTLPEPKVDDSRTTAIKPAIRFNAGEVVATEVGFSKSTAGMDFGIYDLRQPNEASKRADYASRFANEKEFAFYGACFFDYLGDNAQVLKNLPAADSAAGKTSDYCN